MPVLLGQAVYVRTNYLALPEPTGARAGTTGDGPPLRILVIGDSSAAGVGVETQADALLGQLTARLEPHASVTFDLVAQTGAKTVDVLTWLPDLPRAEYDFVVTALGVNDVTKGVSLRRWLQLQERLFDQLSARTGCRQIIVSGLPPIHQFPLLPHPLRWVLGRQAARFDRHLRRLTAQRPDCTTLEFTLPLNESNMSADGFHPGAVVYSAWADEVMHVLATFPGVLDGGQPAP